MAKPLKVWSGSEWVEVATQVLDTDLFLTTAVASATYLPISASFNPDGYLTEATASATYATKSAYAPLNRNLIINGAMQVHQRGTSKTGITSLGYFTADRWESLASNLGTWTQTVETDAPSGSGFTKSLKRLCTTANAAPAAGAIGYVAQLLEGQDVQRIRKGTSNAQELTLSFWVKSNVTGTYVAALSDLDNTRRVSASYTISASATWERKVITFPSDATGSFDNDNSASLYVVFMLGAGSTYTSGTLGTTWGSSVDANLAVGQTNLAAATNNYWQITGVQLETGSTATDFEFEPYEETLRKCQRYYYLHASGASKFISYGDYQSATVAYGQVAFPTAMRTAPSLVIATGTGWYRITTTGLDDDFDNLTIQFATEHGAFVYNNVQISGTAYRGGPMYTNNASAFVAFSAEL